MLVQRVRRALARYGLAGALRAAWHRLLGLVYLWEHHVWYAMDLAGDRPRRDLGPGLATRRGSDSDVALLAQLPTVGEAEARERLAEGNALWLVVEEGTPLFACWIFFAQTPVIAAHGGQMRLAQGTVCLEDSVTAEAARGRGVAPGAWSAIADGLAGEGFQQLITKVDVQNIPSRKAVEKVGFRPAGVMHFLRLGWWSSWRIDAIDLERGPQLEAMLEHA